VPLIFDFIQRTLKPRSDAFDKCSVLEIENSALFLAFRFQDIKDIKRRRMLSRIGAACPSGAINLNTRGSRKTPGMASNGFDCFQTDTRKSAEFLIFKSKFFIQRRQRKCREAVDESGRTARSSFSNSRERTKGQRLPALLYRQMLTHARLYSMYQRCRY